MAHIGHGIIMERGDQETPEVWTKIGRIVDPDMPSFSRDTPDRSHTESVDKWREFMGGMRDGGEVSPTIELDMASDAYGALVADFNDDDPVHYRVVAPSGDEAWDFMALVNNMDHETPLDDNNTVTPTFKITGKPSLEDLS